MTRKRLTALVLTLLMALGLAITVSSPASAGLLPEHDQAVPHAMSSDAKHCVNMIYASACVQPYGDILWLKDQRKDGEGVDLHWKDGMWGRWGVCHNDQGVDSGWTRCNKNLPEGHQIEWMLSYHDGKGIIREEGPHFTTV